MISVKDRLFHNKMEEREQVIMEASIARAVLCDRLLCSRPLHDISLWKPIKSANSQSHKYFMDHVSSMVQHAGQASTSGEYSNLVSRRD